MASTEERKAKREERAREQDYLKEVARIEFIDKVAQVYTISAGELLERASDETPFIIKNAVPEGVIMFLAGIPGGEKSWLAYDMSFAVMRGRPWMCCESVKTGPVLLLNLDNPTHELGRRYKRMGLKPTDPLHIHSMGIHRPPGDLPRLLKLPDAFKIVEALIERIRPVLVIFDSFRQAHNMNELSPECMARLMSFFRDLTAQGSTILILHHIPKPQGNSPEDLRLTLRGTGELEGSADVIAYVTEGQLIWGKTRGWKQSASLCDFEVVDNDSKNTTAVKVIHKFKPLEAALRRGPMKQEALRSELKMNKVSFHILLDQAIALKFVTKEAGGARRIYWNEEEE